jgi:hypothetical protein
MELWGHHTELWGTGQDSLYFRCVPIPLKRWDKSGYAAQIGDIPLIGDIPVPKDKPNSNYGDTILNYGNYGVQSGLPLL